MFLDLRNNKSVQLCINHSNNAVFTANVIKNCLSEALASGRRFDVMLPELHPAVLVRLADTPTTMLNLYFEFQGKVFNFFGTEVKVCTNCKEVYPATNDGHVCCFSESFYISEIDSETRLQNGFKVFDIYENSPEGESIFTYNDVEYYVHIYTPLYDADDTKISIRWSVTNEQNRTEFLRKVEGLKQLKPSIINGRMPYRVFDLFLDDSGLPITVCELSHDSNGISTVALMSFKYEFGNPFSDLEVEFEHPLRGRWLVESDLVYEVDTLRLVKDGIFVGNIPSKDMEIFQNLLENNFEDESFFKIQETRRSAVLLDMVFNS